MSNWPYSSYVDFVRHFCTCFWRFKEMVDTSGWNLMGIAHYAICLVWKLNYESLEMS